tara:strand:- start:5286 stop:7514 length:2229 start_codon:yes stop_codon:yes gene_type:complete
MAEAQLTGAIGLLREENNKKLAELNENQEKTAEATQETARLIGDMLDGMAIDRQRGQDRQEGSPSGGGPSGGGDAPQGNESIGLIGILGRIVAGLSGAVLGLIYGIVKTVTSPFTQLAKSTKDFFKNTKLVQFVKTKFTSMITTIKNFFKPVTAFFSNISKAFGAGLKGETRAVRGAMGRFVSLQKGITGFFASMGRMMNKFILQPFNRIRRAIGSIGRVMNGVTATTGTVGKVFTKVGDGFKMVGRLFSGFARTFGVVFRAFAVVGRVIAWPITVITGLIGGIMQMFKDFGKSREEGDGIMKSLFMGFTGFFKGAINAIIMKPLDMLKDGIGWLLGKLGFENAENALAGFSISGFFTKIWDWMANFVADLPGMIVDALVGAVKGIGNFFSNIDFGGFFGGIGDKVGEWWSGASDGFFKKFEHAKDTFGKLKGKVAGLQDKFRQFIMDKLPEKGSFLERFVPDAVYDWVGQTGQFTPPKKDPAVDEPEKEVEEGEQPQMTKAELQQQLKSDEADLAAAQTALDEGTGSELDVEAAKMFVDATKMQLEGLKELTTTNEEMNKARMEAIKTGDKTPLMEKKLEAASLEDRDIGRAFTQAELDAEDDQATKDWMLWVDSPEGIAHQKKVQTERDEREKEFQIRSAENKLKREAEYAKTMERAMILRAERAEKAREILATGMYKGQQITDEQRRQAQLYIERDEKTKAQQSMVVAPQTNVVNNTAPTTAVMNMNMPAVDNLDTTYG